MLADVNSSEGTGTRGGGARPEAFAPRPARRRCRTNTNHTTGYNYWFASFAPYENPKYAVVVMVQVRTAAVPAARFARRSRHDIYEEILKKENAAATKNVARN